MATVVSDVKIIVLLMKSFYRNTNGTRECSKTHVIISCLDKYKSSNKIITSKLDLITNFDVIT